jgi:DNA-binding transcriptional MerR regulator
MHANKHEQFTIEDLARRSGLSVRTVRYYIQQGLLPGPDTAGKYASYSQRHLDHLRMVQRLKGLHLPLKQIQHLIANMSREDMHQLLHMQDKMALKKLSIKEETHGIDGISSAVDYIEGLAGRQARVKHIAESPPAYAQTHQGLPQSQQPERWSKIRLAEGVELSVREQESRALRDEINQLIAAARTIFGRGNQ